MSRSFEAGTFVALAAAVAAAAVLVGDSDSSATTADPLSTLFA